MVTSDDFVNIDAIPDRIIEEDEPLDVFHAELYGISVLKAEVEIAGSATSAIIDSG